MDFDQILVASVYWDSIREQLIDMGIFESKIEIDGVLLEKINISRTQPISVVARQRQVTGDAQSQTALRVAYILHEYPVTSQTFVKDEIEAVRNLGVEVIVLAVPSVSKSAFSASGLRGKWVTLKECVEGFRPDIIHTHFVEPHCAAMVANICESLEIPFTVKPHAYDIFRQDYQRANRIKKIGRSPYCLAVFALGYYHHCFLIRQGVPPESVHLVRNVTDWARYFNSDRKKLAPRIKRIIAVGRYVEKKGFDLIIRAFRAVSDSDLRLHVVGEGRLYEQYRSLAEGDSRIHIERKFKTRKEIAEVLKYSDLFVLPCRIDGKNDSDGLPTVLIESLAAGVPVLTTSVASIPDLIRHGETGWLAAPGSLSSLMSCLSDALLSEVSVREQMLSRASSLLNGEFAPIRNSKYLVELWRVLLANR
ncbi:Putative teichuronic acid biosynthesis glycosyltransferase TuaC [Thiorhodovibrio litoralis]|nr:Putative teichuronic acid biosynthesis glycosyltransferase TuaC [Thiorhodovibrio litoralis]